MKIQPKRRTAEWVKARFESGRNLQRKHVYGKIAGRAQAGLSDVDWAFVRWLASISDCTISDVVREAVAQSRIDCERDAFEPGEEFPWLVGK